MAPTEDIIELKPNFNGIGINLNALWRRLRRKAVPTAIVPQRFFQLFEAHGVALTQIPRLIPGLNLEHLSSAETLLPVLTPEHLRQAAELFGIRQAWLEGTSKIIYDCHYSYKNPWAFFEDIQPLVLDPLCFPVIAFTSVSNFNWKSGRDQPVLLVVREKCTQLGEKEIYRYRIHDQFLWGYWKSRLQIKAMMRVFYKKVGAPVRVHQIDKRILSDMEEGRVFPGHYFQRSVWLRSMELEDFSLMRSESYQAKEVEELPMVLEYIEAFKLEHVGEKGVENPRLSEEALSFTQ